MPEHQVTGVQLARSRADWVVDYTQRIHQIVSPNKLLAGTVTNDGFDLLRSRSFASRGLATYFSNMPRHQVTGEQLDYIFLHWVVDSVQRSYRILCPTQLSAGVIDDSDLDRR